MATPRRKKAINFDLDTASLRDLFGEKGRRTAYAQIMRFLSTKGFEHRQWSGYVSVDRLSYAETYLVIEELLEKHPWLGVCAKRFDVTDFMTESDATEFIREKTTVSQTDDGIDDEGIS